jgi:hypothetical protein
MGNDFLFLHEYDAWIRFFHVAGSIVALGAVVATDMLLLWLKFKPRLASVIVRVAPFLSLQVWVGLLILSVSGVLLFLPRIGLEQVPLFQFKMLLVLVIFANGIFLNVWVTPRFEKLAPEWEQQTSRVKRFTVIAGIATAISFAAWWGVLFIMHVLY